MTKQIIRYREARETLLRGVQELAETVTITMGPKGRNVAIDKRWAAPAILHDGVSVAKEIDLPDPYENMGAQLIKEAASKTADRAGDGTTTATLLAWKLITKGMRLIEEGVNPMMMREGMDKAVSEVIHTLLSEARPVAGDDIENVATISAASAEIGKVIAEAVRKVGENGVIDVREGMGEETTVEYKEGMQFEKGYAQGSPYFVTDKKNMIVEIQNPMILYTDMIIDSVQDFSDFLDNVLTEEDRNIVIIADTIEPNCMSMLVDNNKRGTIRAYAVSAPSFGMKRIWLLEDMTTLTGGTVVTRQSGRLLSSITKEELGRADHVWANADNTKIIGGRGDKTKVAERIESLRKQIDLQESEFEKKSLRERIAKLSGGAAVIKVGARTETELADRKERVIDAVEATKSAISEGIIAGGGVALLECRDSLRLWLSNTKEKDPDILEGMKLVLSVLDEPIKKILSNAGRNPETIIEKISETLIRNVETDEISNAKNFGYDVVGNRYGDMYEMGIIDPVRVTRQALSNAVSVASMILTTEALVTEIPEKSSPNPELT